MDEPHHLLIRDWWYTYLQVLKSPSALSQWSTRLNELTAECEKRGIVKPHQSMPRDGARDLACDCDQLNRQRGV